MPNRQSINAEKACDAIAAHCSANRHPRGKETSTDGLKIKKYESAVKVDSARENEPRLR